MTLVTSIARNESARLIFLDGIRGWGAVVVLLYHIFVGEGIRPNPEMAQLVRLVFFNGTFAVLSCDGLRGAKKYSWLDLACCRTVCSISASYLCDLFRDRYSDAVGFD